MPDPLATLILTRPREASERFLAQLGSDIVAKLHVVVSPLTEIVPIGDVPDRTGFRGVIFSSANGVRFAGPGRGMTAYCVGPATSAAAADAGWDAREAGATADDLVDALIAGKPQSPLLHIGGVHRRGDVAHRLSAAGIETAEAVVYEQRPLPLKHEAEQALSSGDPVVVPLFSPRAARHFASLIEAPGRLHLVAISAAAMAETAQLGALSRCVAPEPNAESICNTISNLLRRVEADDSPK